MLQLEHKKRIVDACFPETFASANEYWHDVKPVKFGESLFYGNAIQTVRELASYVIPEDSAYLLILRVECYTTVFDPTLPGYGQHMPPPQGAARWAYTDIEPLTPAYRLSPDLPIHLYADTDQFLFAKGDHRISLVATLSPVTGAQAGAVVVRTLVYGYLLGALVADRLGASESTYSFEVLSGDATIPPSPGAVRPPI
jgi:hypothetical protein